MGHYVYQYLHPEYGHLYCGRTNDLDKRIYEHNNLKTDNISREYEELLRESIVMYVELSNKAQEVAVEAYCIDKYKPYLNKMLKYDEDNGFILDMKLPKWHLYDPKKLKYKQQLCIANTEKLQIIDEISNIENEIEIKKETLNIIKFDLAKINYEIKMQENIKKNNVLFGFNLNDIKWFYKHCDNKDVKFYSEVYDKIGKLSAEGCIYYDTNRNGLTLKYWSCTNKDNNERILTDNEGIFIIIVCTLYDFYPDINIYPELYAALLSKKDDLLITNTMHNLKDLMNSYDSCCVDSSNGVNVEFVAGEIIYCSVRLDLNNNIYKGVHNLPTSDNYMDYTWYKEDGISLIDENRTHYCIKESLDVDIQNYLFSQKYYHPDYNVKEEDYCNKMILKYEIQNTA